jgi:chemotaxis protein CheD
MLPDSELTKQAIINDYKYVNTAIPILIEQLHAQGARKYSLKAKLAGGAQMFQFESSSDAMRIGPRNVEAVEQQLQEFNIPIVSKDVGGKHGRTIEFDPSTGMLEVKTVFKGIEFI